MWTRYPWRLCALEKGDICVQRWMKKVKNVRLEDTHQDITKDI